MASKYASFIKTLWLVSIYSSIVPMGVIISIFCLIAVYWSDKYLLLRRYCRPNLLSQVLNKNMTEFAQLCPLMMCLGSILFSYLMFNNENKTGYWVDIAGIIICVIAIIFPCRKIAKLN